ncbi:Receptor-type tyrosine-protein phosphatase kappa [Lamellibrachia satsuma]|nr:Receptor-type tyrosine-protein phosphatase kappa [Lamellibrachia satsuma]
MPVGKAPGYDSNKCDLYWPLTTGVQAQYGKFTVITLSCDVYSDYTLRTFLLTCQGERRTITHFQFTSWPDKGVPKYTYPLLTFRRLVRSFDDRSTGPIIVHCSAGVGQTGTFIALDSLLDQGQAEGQVDVFSFACHLRTERMDMVETRGQYMFLYHALLDGLQTGRLAYPVSQYPVVYKKLCVDNEDATELKKQFQMLETLKPVRPAPSCAALQKANIAKNQSLDVIPDDKNRPFLSTKSPRTNDYINAVFVDSFWRHNGYLLTQMPLPNTIVDFWRLVYDQECPIIIVLDEVEMEGSTTYWPEKDQDQTYGSLTVKQLQESDSSMTGVIERTLRVHVTAKPKKVHTVKQYQLMSGWPKTDRLPSSTNTLLSLMELVNRPVSKDDHSGPVILQCKNGAIRSGLFCTASHLLGSLTVDQYVDVFHSAQHVRNKQPQAIDCVEQYKFLHLFAVHYQQQFRTYENID